MNNRGFSLVKLVILIAALAVAFAGLFFLINNTSRRETTSGVQNMGVSATVSPTDAAVYSPDMSDAEKQELTAWLSGMDVEEFNSTVGSVMNSLSDSDKKAFIAWLKENRFISGDCDAAGWQLPATFVIPDSVPWPQGMPQPRQGRVSTVRQGGDTLQVQIDSIAKATYASWTERMLSNGWAENATELESIISDAVAADLGPSAQTAKAFFDEAGMAAPETRYFATEDDIRAAELAFGGNTALLTVTSVAGSAKTDDVKIMEASWNNACIAPLPAPGGGRLTSYNKDAKTPSGMDGQVLVADQLTPEIIDDWYNAMENAGWTRLDEAPSVFSSDMAYPDGSAAKTALDYMTEHDEPSTADIKTAYFITTCDDGRTYAVEVLTHGSFAAVTINAD